MSSKPKLVQNSLLLSFAIVVLLAIVVGLNYEDSGSELAAVSPSESEGAANSASTFDGTLERQVDNQQSSKSVPSYKVLPYKSKLGPLPDSLDGTVMKQALVVDEHGSLRISSDIQRVFDFFLSTIEEESLDTILARINEYLDFHLDQPALDESKQILAQYIDLKQALYDFEQSRSASLKLQIESGQLAENKELYMSLLSEQLSEQAALRQEYLSAEVYEAFYAESQAFDDYTLARMRVESDHLLSSDEKLDRLAQVDAQAPQEIVESRRRAQVTDVLKERTAQLTKQGASSADIRALRTDMFGAEAADRFDALDAQRAQWKSRLANYLTKRSEIMSIEGLSMEARQQQVDLLRSNQFDAREQVRVRVYEARSDV
jgi:lipase chaperone LimK